MSFQLLLEQREGLEHAFSKLVKVMDGGLRRVNKLDSYRQTTVDGDDRGLPNEEDGRGQVASRAHDGIGEPRRGGRRHEARRCRPE